MTLFLELLALAGLILLNAFFVAAEYGLVTSRRTRILELEHEGNRRARSVRRITSDPPRFISAMQLGVTISSLAIGALGEQVLAHRFDSVMASFLAVLLALLIVTYLHVVIGELVPKGIALGHPERTALAVSTPVRWFFIVFRPLIWLLQESTAVLLRALGLEPPGAEHEAHSEAELRMLLSSSAEQGEIEHEEQDLLEEIVGEIEDEFDVPDETVERIDDDTIRVDGTFPIDDFNEQFGADLPQDDYHTIAGFVFGRLGRTAGPGDTVTNDGITFTVDSVDGQRIDRLTVKFQPWDRRETA